MRLSDSCSSLDAFSLDDSVSASVPDGLSGNAPSGSAPSEKRSRNAPARPFLSTRRWGATAVAIVGLSLTFGCPIDPIGNDAGTSEPSPFPDTPTPGVDPAPNPSPEPAVDGGSTDDGGNASDFDAGPSPVYIESVSPSTGVLTGGIRVRISGDAFTPDSQIFFNDVEADQMLYLNNRAITVRVPAGLVAGPADVRIENDLGTGFLEGAFTYFSPVSITSVVPNVGSSAGGESVQLSGEGFTEDMIVLVGGTPVVNYAFESETSATFLTPPGLSGRVDVVALDAFGRSVLPFGFTYSDDLVLERVFPQFIPATNTAVLDVFGSGFDEATTFAIGGQNAVISNFISSSRVRLEAPAALLGYADLVAVRGTFSATLADAFFFADAPAGGLSLVSAMPRILDAAGGESVALGGTALDTVTSVKVDGNDVTFTAQDATQIKFISPAIAAGMVDIEITDDVTTLSLSVAYESRLSLASLTPGQGEAAGGTEVNLVGANFAEGMRVFFGAIEAAQVVFVDENNATATSPFGAPGLSDVTVVVDDARSTLPGAFLYQSDLSVLGVRPARGGISGNTFVTISGSGFTLGDVTVRFAQLEATSVTVVSDSLITARTPFNAPGSVDVTVDIAGQLPVVAQRAYTYFDPSILVGGTRGGAVDGALNLTAIDALSGMPIEGLLAFLGTEGGGSVMAKTNILGQATLSGLEVVGPQTVSVVGNGYEYASLVDVNASEVTVFLQPLNLVPPEGEGPPPPPPPPPATMRGRIFGFAKEFFDPAALSPDEIALAVVVTTARDEFSGTPDPGGDNVVFAEGGEYFIANSRTGQVAIVALAGIFNLDTAQFRIKQMGVLRGVFPQRGVDLIDQDVDLNIPLDKEIDLSLPDAPVGILDGPTVTRVLPFLRFGGEGAFAYTQAVDTSRNHDLDTMPDVPGEMLTFFAGAYRTDGTGLVTDEGSATMIEGDDIVLGVGTDWAQVDFFGRLLVEGAVFVIEGENGEKWASYVARSLGPGEILLSDKAPFTLAGATFHIGTPGLPSSEVMQDGVGDLIGGVTIQPVLGIPEPLSPVKNGVLTNRTLRWKPAPGQQPSMHQMWVYDPINFSILWTFYIDGDRSKVPLPRIPDVEGMAFDIPPPEMAAGGYLWQHVAMYAPGFDYNSFSYLDIGTRARRAWTTNATLFVYGGD